MRLGRSELSLHFDQFIRLVQTRGAYHRVWSKNVQNSYIVRQALSDTQVTSSLFATQ